MRACAPRQRAHARAQKESPATGRGSLAIQISALAVLALLTTVLAAALLTALSRPILLLLLTRLLPATLLLTRLLAGLIALLLLVRPLVGIRILVLAHCGSFQRYRLRCPEEYLRDSPANIITLRQIQSFLLELHV
jgi:hypothetical protein